MIYEYKTFNEPFPNIYDENLSLAEQIKEALDALGKEGWKLATVLSGKIWIFVREVKINMGTERCLTSIHPGTEKVEWRCILNAGHIGDHCFGECK